jgi:hypothetical protein
MKENPMIMKDITGYDINDALELLGLQRKPTLLSALLPAVALVSVGAAVGAGVGLAFAPSSGRRLRKEFGDRIDQLRERIKTDSPRSNANAIAHGHTP